MSKMYWPLAGGTPIAQNDVLLQFTLISMGVFQIHNLRSDFSNEGLIGEWRSVGSKEKKAPIYIEIICVVLFDTLSSLKILSWRESLKLINYSN